MAQQTIRISRKNCVLEMRSDGCPVTHKNGIQLALALLLLATIL
jgi:hypothetical protein